MTEPKPGRQHIVLRPAEILQQPTYPGDWTALSKSWHAGYSEHGASITAVVERAGNGALGARVMVHLSTPGLATGAKFQAKEVFVDGVLPPEEAVDLWLATVIPFVKAGAREVSGGKG